MNMLCNFIHDWGNSIKEGLGKTWLTILFAVFIFCALFLLQDFLRASINKTKIKIKWGVLFLLIIFTLFAVWFGILLFD